MRIAIDAREIGGQPTGVGRYLSEILRSWEGLPEAREHDYILCAPRAVPYSGAMRISRAVRNGAGGTMWEQTTLPEVVRAADADVLFCPGYSGPIFDRTPLVLAVHDVSFAAHPEWFGWREGLRRRVLTRAAARRAARVLTLTEFSKREIVEHLGIPAESVEVVYPGVVAHPPVTKRDGEPLVLYVGSIFNRRHVPETIRGFERLARRHPEVRLAIVGDNRTVPHIALDRLVADPAQVQIHSYVSDGVLAELYGRARAFVFLSEYEGFGLTPLEALAAGIPVVVLDTPVAREVYGKAAFYVSAPEPKQIERALEVVLFDATTRSQLLQHGRWVVTRYSWRECAIRVLAALERAADRR